MMDFGDIPAPKSTRPLTTCFCPSRPGHQALRNTTSQACCCFVPGTLMTGGCRVAYWGLPAFACTPWLVADDTTGN
ncbi:hypothetical protein [Thiolapillus sp.]|uniref:hypothetical protein n=1 Tax=Thiolapillus sp. TaxID=2017437 RepID=UPI003AF78DFF